MFYSNSLSGYQLTGGCAWSICECKCKTRLNSVDITKVGAVIEISQAGTFFWSYFCFLLKGGWGDSTKYIQLYIEWRDSGR